MHFGGPSDDLLTDAACKSDMSEWFLFFKEDFIYLLLERGREGEKYPLTWPLLGTWPATQACADRESNQWPFDQELNWHPFGLQVDTQSTEPHQPGLIDS